MHNHIHDHSPNEDLHDHNLDHGHTHEHAHEHEHTHEHAHTDGAVHIHEHGHTHEHGCDHRHDTEHAHSHDELLKSRQETAAFLQYTLSHNAHHEEELSGLVHSLQHLGLESAAGEIASCIVELTKVNARLDTVLKSLK